MAYNTYYPTYPGYNPYTQALMQQQMQQQYSQQIPQNQPVQPAPNRIEPQIQNGGFVPCRGKAEAQNYPVAPGNSVMFRDETAPYIYTKTVGYSQLDRPVFEAYRLVKEDDASKQPETPANTPAESTGVDLSLCVSKNEFEAVLRRIEALEKNAKPLASRVDAIEAIFPQRKPKKKEESDDA